MKNPWKLLKLLPILVIKQFFISKAPFFVLGLLVSYDFTENWANSLMMDYLSYSLKSDRITAIITNLQDGVSDIFVIFFSSVSEASTGSFTMMAFCSSGTIVMYPTIQVVKGLVIKASQDLSNASSLFQAANSGVTCSDPSNLRRIPSPVI
ncbi:uncharacterized protein DS421_2g53610 [Arachis hypogaea]|nr:uncharacterized protein DS421_2g53610 [Arachis hypogaea]